MAAVPIDDTLLYVEPIYVESSTNGIPTLKDVVVVYNHQAYQSDNASLDNALCQIANPNGSKPFSQYCTTPAALNTPLITGGGQSNSQGNGTSGIRPPRPPRRSRRRRRCRRRPRSLPPLRQAGARPWQSLLNQAKTLTAEATAALKAANSAQAEAYLDQANSDDWLGRNSSSVSPDPVGWSPLLVSAPAPPPIHRIEALILGPALRPWAPRAPSWPGSFHP